MRTHRTTRRQRRSEGVGRRLLAWCSLAVVLVTAAGLTPAHAAVDQRYRAWGANNRGQLGDGRSQVGDGSGAFANSASARTPTPNNAEWDQISARGYNTIALKDAGAAGTVWAWGDNIQNRLGNNTTCDSPNPGDNCESDLPVQVKVDATNNLTGVKEIAAGLYHNLALKTDGTVWAWGANGFGQLGDNTTTDRNVAVQVKNSAGTGNLVNISHIAAGFHHSLAIDNKATAAATDDSVWAWGRNANGQLGDGTTTPRSKPVAVLAADGGAGTLTSVAAVSGGGGHSLALKTNGTSVAWGSDEYGQLCNGTTTTADQSSPVSIPSVAGVTDTAVAAGGFHTLLLKSDTGVRACGSNESGQLGNGTTCPILAAAGNCQSAVAVQVKNATNTGTLVNIVTIAAGGFHSLAIDNKATAAATDDKVAAWGDNGLGQLGNGTTISSPLPVTVKVEVAAGVGASDLTGPTAISAGYNHSVALVP